MTATGKHLRPRYYGYKGGFAKVTVCKDCGSTGLYEDQHPVNPCNNCGGRPIENFTAKFNGKRWTELKVFKKTDMELFFKGSVDDLIEKSQNSSPEEYFPTAQEEEESKVVVGGLAKFFPSIF